MAIPNIVSESLDSRQERLQAGAINLDGASINQDLSFAIGDYQRDEGVLWQLITKTAAKAPTVTEGIKITFPTVGAVDRLTLNHTAAGVLNPLGTLDRDFNDPGQDLKAISGEISIPHFAHSMSTQQNHPYEDTFADDTDDLIKAGIRYLDRQLIVGDATANVNEFNGLLNLRSANPINADVTLDLTSATNTELIHQAINRICTRAANQPNNMSRISHIFTSGGGQNELVNEAYASHIHQNEVEITPGHIVNGIVTTSGRSQITPVISSPYILDDAADPAFDLIDFWLIDLSSIQWHGLYPVGGQRTFDFQIFDFTKFINSNPLTEKRMLLLYGTLYAKNRGRGIYRLQVKLPKGRAIVYP